MKVKIFGAVVFSCVVMSVFSGAAFAQIGPSPVPFGGSHPFERFHPIPPDQPDPNAQSMQKLPNGYTEQQMQMLMANPGLRIHPDGTIEHLHMSGEELKKRASNNPDVLYAPPGWNSRPASEAISTPGPPAGAKAPHPIQPASN